MWQGRLPRDLLRDTRESYVTRNTSHLRTEVPGGVVDCALGTNPLGIPDSVRAFLASPQNWDPGCYPPPDLVSLRKPSRSTLATRCHERTHRPRQRSFGVLLTLLRILLPPGSLLGGVSPQFTDVPLQAMLNNVRFTRWSCIRHFSRRISTRGSVPHEDVPRPLRRSSPQPDGANAHSGGARAFEPRLRKGGKLASRGRGLRGLSPPR
jgi:hypothetical protein